MDHILLPQLHELQSLHDNPVIVYSAAINGDSVCTLYECLRRMGPVQHLNLVLSTPGGVVTTTRKLALLLREFTHHLTILVPYQARSAGTLLCLSADELVLGPMAELGPIDTQMGSAGSPPPDAPSMVSAEDIRAFRHVAEDWFGVSREKDRLQVLALVAQRMFPPSLGSFYRSERLIRKAAHELLRFQLPNAEEHVQQDIVDRLVSGYDSHDHVITRTEAQSLGLRVRFTSPQEETLLWDLSKTNRRQSFELSDLPSEGGVTGLILSAHFCARQVWHWERTPEGLPDHQGEGGAQPQKRLHISWEIDEQ